MGGPCGVETSRVFWWFPSGWPPNGQSRRRGPARACWGSSGLCAATRGCAPARKIPVNLCLSARQCPLMTSHLCPLPDPGIMPPFSVPAGAPSLWGPPPHPPTLATISGHTSPPCLFWHQGPLVKGGLAARLPFMSARLRMLYPPEEETICALCDILFYIYFSFL